MGDAAGETLPIMTIKDVKGSEIFLEGNWPSLEKLLPTYIAARRWFQGKARQVRAVQIQEVIPAPFAGSAAYFVLAVVSYASGESEIYSLPLASDSAQRAEPLLRKYPYARVAHLEKPEEESREILYDALADNRFCDGLLEAIAGGSHFEGEAGSVWALPSSVFGAVRGPKGVYLEPAPVGAEQTNSSVIYGDRLILKLFRRIEEGVNPDLEIGRFLTEKAHFSHIPPLAGALEYQRKDGVTASLAILQGLVTNRGDAWQHALDSLESYFGRAAAYQGPPETPVPPKPLISLGSKIPALAGEAIGDYLEWARLLGQRTAELHQALASVPDDPDFAPEPLSAEYRDSLLQAMRAAALHVLEVLRLRLPELPEEAKGDAQGVLRLEEAILGRFEILRDLKMEVSIIRCHGDYHLGQVLFTGNDFVIVDFEGEPMRPLSERRRKQSPLRDVAGMVRSFDYAAYTALARRTDPEGQPEGRLRLEPWARFWYTWVSAAFLESYLGLARHGRLLPEKPEEVNILLEAHLLEKAIYETGYELNNRPDWVKVPLRGVLQLMESGGGAAG